MDNDKIDQHSDEIEVESEEKERGKKIEIDEDRLPSRAMAIHEHIRQDGEKELERDAMALLWSAIAAGLSMGASLLAKGIFHVELEGVPGSFLLENLGYTFGFIIVIMARQQLFTENTVTAVLPVMQKPTMSNVGLLMRLWASCCWVIFSGQVLRRGHLNICQSSMKKLAMHLSKSAWM
ncbi:formate/nitrite transporter family protein [Escherichia coli]|nr:formate/nitrite transporter family protein [Escherichia coli]MCR1197908.1 formate/nitrite transporter family protein [Escherichia coli]MCR8529379.1 formate/nitrite transporter family protein [Escherichia coli]MDY9525459.1 formate/nitrite transporter family protein [Escherichia coli]